MFSFDHDRRAQLLPKIFLDSELRRLIDSQKRYLSLPYEEKLQTDPPTSQKVLLDSDVLTELKELSHGRCAFCEAKAASLTRYRFRPMSHATPYTGPDDRYCYVWLSLRWENLFPICRECRPTNEDYFPVDGRRAEPPENVVTLLDDPASDMGKPDEKALLYFPGELPTPRRALRVRRNGAFVARNKRFRETIEHFSLNRPNLVAARKHTIDDILRALQIGRPIELFEASEFAGTRFALLDQIATHLAAAFAAAKPKSGPAMLRAIDLWRETREDFDGQLQEATRALDDPLEAGIRPSTGEIGIVPGQASFTLSGAKQKRSTNPRLEHAPLKKISVENFKSLESVSLELPKAIPDPGFHGRLDPEEGALPEAPCLLILGENATGKSSLLEAIALALLPASKRRQLKDLAADRLILAPEYMGSGPGARAPTSAKIALEFHDGRKVELAIHAGRSGGNFEGPKISDGANSETLPLLFAYGAHRLYSKRQPRSPTRNVDTLFTYDRFIPNPDPWLARLARKRAGVLEEVVAALRHVIEIDGEFESIQTSSPQGSSCVINIKRFHSEAAGTTPSDNEHYYTVPQRLDVASSGYRAAIALVCDIFYGLLEASDYDPRAARMAQAIVLIDEIEAHLHPRWKMTLLQRLRRALPRTTFIATSHDPLCIRGMLPDEVLMMNRYQTDDGAKQREAVEPFRPGLDVSTMTVEQLLTSDFFQLLSTDDASTERQYQTVLQALSKDKDGRDLTEEDKRALKLFREELMSALPYGRTEIPRLVQEAVAEYLARRRDDSPSVSSDRREKAKKELMEFFEELLA